MGKILFHLLIFGLVGQLVLFYFTETVSEPLAPVISPNLCQDTLGCDFILLVDRLLRLSEAAGLVIAPSTFARFLNVSLIIFYEY